MVSFSLPPSATEVVVRSSIEMVGRSFLIATSTSLEVLTSSLGQVFPDEGQATPPFSSVVIALSFNGRSQGTRTFFCLILIPAINQSPAFIFSGTVNTTSLPWDRVLSSLATLSGSSQSKDPDLFPLKTFLPAANS